MNAQILHGTTKAFQFPMKSYAQNIPGKRVREYAGDARKLFEVFQESEKSP
jgi:hypothetical protein